MEIHLNLGLAGGCPGSEQEPGAEAAWHLQRALYSVNGIKVC